MALTFDDGPSSHTDRLLDVLTHGRTRATFFVLGRSVERNPVTAKRIVDDGHAIGNHGWAHADLRRLSPEQLASEISRTNTIISETTGQTPTLIRPAYGAYDDDVQRLSYGLAHWDVDTRDWEHRNPARTVATAMDQVQSGSVVLIHDLHEPSVDAVALMLLQLRAAGHRLVTMPELLGEIEPGRVYFSQHRSEEPPPPTTTTSTTTTTTTIPGSPAP